MFCYSVFHDDKQIKVFPYEPHGDDWKRARTLAVETALQAEQNGYCYTVEHFGVSGVGTVVWQ